MTIGAAAGGTITVGLFIEVVGYKDCDEAIAREWHDAEAAESNHSFVGSGGVDDRCWRSLLDFAVLG